MNDDNAGAGAVTDSGSATTPEEVESLVLSWLAEYDTPTADAAHILCDRHDPEAAAFTIVETDMSARTLTYGELADSSRRLATVLAEEYGVTRGDRVPILLGKGVDLIVALLAVWRLGAVHVPLFTAFATGAIEMRVSGSGARLVITQEDQRSKLEPIPGITIVQTGAELDAAVAAASPLAGNVAVGGGAALVRIFTSGTTGKPKGVDVPVKALAAFRSYIEISLGVTADDVFWNAADPGWAYGLYYALMGPMASGRTSLQFRGGFTPASTLEVIREHGVTNFAGAPTMYRAINKSGLDIDVTLRRASSAGEPLTPDVVAWAQDALGTEVRDDYGQTELGMVICNHWHPAVARPVKPASMGVPAPGITAGEYEGQIAIDVPASPMFWFGGYHDAPEKTAERFTEDGRWYLTGDTGRVDEDGHLFFTARDDDVILAAGYRIGPFDVESVLVTHPAVAEVAVVGRPDPEGIRGELVEAFVVLSTDAGAEAGAGSGDDAGSDAGSGTDLAALEKELQTKVREEYSRHAYPRTVHFVAELPKTPSGKIQRFLLRRGDDA